MNSFLLKRENNLDNDKKKQHMLLAVALCLSTNLFCDEILRYIQ